MNIKLSPTALCGSVRAIASKSYMHRALICAALADKSTDLICPESNRDIIATTNCLRALGAEITDSNGIFSVTPIKRSNGGLAELACDESGSTLRFLLPVAASLGKTAVFHARGRLSARPLSPLYEELVSHGVMLSPNGVFPLTMSGQLLSGAYALNGGISSQFFTGLLLALPSLSEKSTIAVNGKLESMPYVRLTQSVMNRFGVFPTISEQFMEVLPAVYHSPACLCIEGDWSNAAFWLVAGAIGGEIKVSGLQLDSMQGDKEIVSLLQAMGADITKTKDSITVKQSKLHSISINAEDIPDLVPILSVAAACAEGKTTIYGASRLRLKESDRINSVLCMLKSLGITCEETPDGLNIYGGKLTGGIVDAYNDHRIAMSAAISSLACDGDVTIVGAQAVDKSYPAFFEDLKSLGGVCTIV